MRSLRAFPLVVVLALGLHVVSGQVSIVADIDGPQAGTSSLGTGTLVGVLSSDLKTLTYQVTYGKLEGTFSAAHFHSALSGSVVESITFSGNTASGTWSNIPDSLLKNLFGGKIYINIHSSTSPGGEIRGTLEPRQLLFSMKLDSTQAGTSSPARGTGYASLAEDGSSDIEYRITVAGLAGTYSGAHFHSLPAGGVVHGFTTSDSVTFAGLWSAPPDSAYSLFLKKNIYANIHSSVNPGGEIRGTAEPVGELALVATIDGSQAGTGSTAQGTAWAVLNATDLSVRYHATYAGLQGTFSGSHFHTTVGGGVIHPITFTGNSTSSNQWTSLTNANLQDLMKGRVYINIHSSTQPGGEIRGDLSYRDGTFVAKLDGTQAGTSSAAQGTAWAKFTNNDTLRYRVTIAGLEGTFSAAHFHYVPTAGVIQAIAFSDSNAAGTWVPADTMTYHFVKGNVYVNVHSSTQTGGEIRGDLKLALGPLTGIGRVPGIVPQTLTLDQNYPNPFNPKTVIGFQLSVQSKVSLRIYDMLGREVATLVDGVKDAGEYRVTFDAAHLTSGVYFYRLEAGEQNLLSRKMLLVK